MNTTFVFLALFISGLFPHLPDPDVKVKPGDKVPYFHFEESPGIRKNIYGYKGKVVLILFFATWCGPCREELPHAEKDIFNRYSGRDDFAMLIFGREHDRATVDRFKSDYHYNMPFFPDQHREIYSKFANQGIPRSFLIGKDGKILAVHLGYNTEDFEKLKHEVDKALQ
jgi:thiol-disulfide isomerase/thioredoxin